MLKITNQQNAAITSNRSLASLTRSTKINAISSSHATEEGKGSLFGLIPRTCRIPHFPHNNGYRPEAFIHFEAPLIIPIVEP